MPDLAGPVTSVVTLCSSVLGACKQGHGLLLPQYAARGRAQALGLQCCARHVVRMVMASHTSRLAHMHCWVTAKNPVVWCRPNVGLVIEGAALATALLRHNAQPFLGLCKACRGVVCCRVTPMQKAQVVALVKQTGAITLGEHH